MASEGLASSFRHHGDPSFGRGIMSHIHLTPCIPLRSCLSAHACPPPQCAIIPRETRIHRLIVLAPQTPTSSASLTTTSTTTSRREHMCFPASAIICRCVSSGRQTNDPSACSPILCRLFGGHTFQSCRLSHASSHACRSCRPVSGVQELHQQPPHAQPQLHCLHLCSVPDHEDRILASCHGCRD